MNNEELGRVVTLISNVGFPIVAWLLLFFKMDSTLQKLTSAIYDLKEVILRGRG